MNKSSLGAVCVGAFLGLSLICTTLGAFAATMTIVSGDSTLGNYNNSLGDLGAPSGNLPWFPAPNTFTGPQDEIFPMEPDLSSAASSLGDWLNDPANLNSNWSVPMAIPQDWAVNQEVAIVYAFDAGPGLRDITANFDLIDNGIHIWVDGVWKFGARDPEGRAWTNIALGDVGAGMHYIQIMLEDSGGATRYVNPEITGTLVPIPATLYLFGSGLVGLVGLRKKFKK